MKIAIVSANFGGIDNVLPIPKQTMEFDRFIINERECPYPLPNLDNRTKARYIKILPHRWLPGYDVYIWLDGRVEVTSENFVGNFVEQLHQTHFCVTLHGYRTNVYDELKFILHEMNKGNHYLISRYGHQQLRRELDFYYKEDLPKAAPLLSSGMFARWNETHNNMLCDEWFMKSIEYSNFDQAMLTYMLDKTQSKVNYIPYDNEFYRVLKHIEHEPY